MKIRHLLAFLLALALGHSMGAWNGLEHMTVANIAYARLNPAARKKVDWAATQITLNGITFNVINLATWADQIKRAKNDPYSRHYNNWHFIDWGIKPTDPDLVANPPELTVRNGDIVTALKHCEAVIAGKKDPLIPNEAVAIALIWHLMGDLHQPLHCAADIYSTPIKGQTTDAGGNAVDVSNFVDAYPNLHAFWDGVLEGSYDPSTKKFVNPTEPESSSIDLNSPILVKMTDAVLAANTGSADVTGGDYAQWATDSHQLAVTAYASLGQDYEAGPVVLSESYISNTQAVAKSQVYKAGVRLAAVLNRLYP